MIDVKALKPGTETPKDAGDPLGLRPEGAPVGRGIAAVLTGLGALALYLKSFLGPADASAARPGEAPAPGPGPDGDGTATAPRVLHMPAGPRADPRPEAAGADAPQGARLSDIAFFPGAERMAAGGPALPDPLPMTELGANSLLPPFREPLPGPAPLPAAAAAPAPRAAAQEPAPVTDPEAEDDAAPDTDPTGPEVPLADTGTDRAPPAGSPIPSGGDFEDPAARNRAPRAPRDLRLGDLGSGAALAIALSHLLAGASDPDGDPLSVRIDHVSHGTLRADGTGWVYTADTERLGEATIAYTVSDGAFDISRIATLEIVRNIIDGGPGPDVLTGTPGMDLLRGFGGGDVIVAQGGDDIALGGAGDDLIRGGAGDDLLEGGTGNDTILGGDGDDTILGGDGDDQLSGEDGDDAISGGDGDDDISGGAGSDEISGGDGDDRIDAGAGDDIVTGGAGDDLILGGAGDDDLSGGAGADSLDGGDGDDQLSGGDGDDALSGGDGADRVLGGAGDDGISGGAGDDLLSGGDGTDTVEGGDGDDALSGGAGDDALSGGAGSDVLEGDAGHDAIAGGDGDDLAFGGAGDDTIRGEDGGDILLGGAGGDEISGGAGDDIVQGGTGADTIDAGDGDDTVLGEADGASDRISGGAGHDTLDHSGAAGGVTLDLAAGTVTHRAPAPVSDTGTDTGPEAAGTADAAETDSFDGFEAFVATAEDDTIILAGPSAEIRGNGGDDLFELRAGDAVGQLHSVFAISDFDDGDIIMVSGPGSSSMIRHAIHDMEDRIEEMFESYSDGLGADEPRLRYVHDWTEDYRRTLVEVNFDRDDRVDITLMLEGPQLLTIDHT